MNEYILFVDDDEHILRGVKRQLAGRFTLEIALGGTEGLKIIDTRGPFAVVVADMNMPEMNGIEFLTRVHDISPDTVRMMLTGNADMQTAIDAVNEGHIFRFMTKPCPTEALARALAAGIQQYHLITAEHELLQNTLTGSVKVLTDILSLVNPVAFSRASRVRRYVSQIACELKLPNVWQHELAAMLSQIGCLTLMPHTLDKIYADKPLTNDERQMLANHPTVGSTLLANIPRLQPIARIIAQQNKPFKDFNEPNPQENEQNDTINLGSQILKVALDFDQLVTSGMERKAAFLHLTAYNTLYNPDIVMILENLLKNQNEEQQGQGVLELAPADLQPGMVTYEDIRAKNGILLIGSGQEITYPILIRLQAFARQIGLREPLKIVEQKTHLKQTLVSV